MRHNKRTSFRWRDCVTMQFRHSGQAKHDKPAPAGIKPGESRESAEHDRGFTLIELIVFIVVGAIILPTSFVAFSSAIQYFSRPDYHVKARFYAEQKMEELTSNRYCCVCLNHASLSCASACPVSGSCTMGSDDTLWTDSPETGFTRTWDICYVTQDSLDPDACSLSETDYKRLRVTIIPFSGDRYTVKTSVTRRPKP